MAKSSPGVRKQRGVLILCRVCLHHAVRGASLWLSLTCSNKQPTRDQVKLRHKALRVAEAYPHDASHLPIPEEVIQIYGNPQQAFNQMPYERSACSLADLNGFFRRYRPRIL